MSKPAQPPTVPVSVELDLEDEASIEAAAKLLGTTPAEVRTTILFAQKVMQTAEERELTRGQMVTALMSVLTIMVKACGTTDEQGQFCFRLFEGLWASCDLPTADEFNTPTQEDYPDFPLTPTKGKDSIH